MSLWFSILVCYVRSNLCFTLSGKISFPGQVSRAEYMMKCSCLSPWTDNYST